LHPDFKQKLLHLSLEILTLTWTNNTYSFTLLVTVKIFASCMITGRGFFSSRKTVGGIWSAKFTTTEICFWVGFFFFLSVYFIIPSWKQDYHLSQSVVHVTVLDVWPLRYPNKDQLEWRQTSILNCRGNIAHIALFEIRYSNFFLYAVWRLNT